MDASSIRRDQTLVTKASCRSIAEVFAGGLWRVDELQRDALLDSGHGVSWDDSAAAPRGPRLYGSPGGNRREPQGPPGGTTGWER